MKRTGVVVAVTIHRDARRILLSVLVIVHIDNAREQHGKTRKVVIAHGQAQNWLVCEDLGERPAADVEVVQG